MPLRTQLAGAVLCFALLNLILVFSSIGLFTRMGPAIEQILQRNDKSIAAAEDLLCRLVLAAPENSPGTRLEQADESIAQLRSNVTETGEATVVDAIQGELQDAFAGDQAARGKVTSHIRELIDLNRQAMLAADTEAQQFGRAGAWSAAFLGMLLLGSLVLFARSLGMRVVQPVRELSDVLAVTQTGDPFRRCNLQRAAPELRQIMTHVNGMLDARGIAAADVDAQS